MSVSCFLFSLNPLLRLYIFLTTFRLLLDDTVATGKIFKAPFVLIII